MQPLGVLDRPPIDSKIIDANQILKIVEWLGTDKLDLELLYRGSENGFEAPLFHQKCDNKGSTLVLIKSENGNLFGGFTTKSW